MSTGGHSVRGRRRGRPPGVRSLRSTTQPTRGSLKRTMAQQPERPSKSAATLERMDIADENEHAESSSDAETSDSEHTAPSPKTALARGGGRKRGRPPGRTRTRTRSRSRNATADQENIRATGARSSNADRKRKSSVKDSSPAASPAPNGSQAFAGAAASAVVDPMVFVQRAVSEGHTASSADTQKLTDYLCSSITLPDDTVLTTLPKRKPAAANRDRNAMTLPDLALVGRQKARNNQEAQPSKSDLEKKMQSELSEWVQSMAETMNRISARRRNGMLRDSLAVSLQTTDEPTTHQKQQARKQTSTIAKPEDGDLYSEKQLGNAGLDLAPVLPPPLPEPAPRAREPPRTKTWWDQLLVDAIDRHKEVTMLSRRRKVVLRKRSKQIEREDDERKAKLGIFKSPEQAERALREQHKRLAKWTVQQVMKKWSYMESIISDQRQVEEEEEKSKQDKRLLFDMLHRSTQLLEEQRTADLSASSSSASSAYSSSTESGASDNEGGEGSAITSGVQESSNSESGTSSDEGVGRSSTLSELIADKHVDVEELRRRYSDKQNAASGDSRGGEQDAETESQVLTSDEDAVISSEQSDTEFSSESSDGADSNDEMAELQRDQDVPMSSLLDQYCEREQVSSRLEADKDGEEDMLGIEHLATPRKPAHDIEQPFLLRGSLREYQRQGLDWLASLHQHDINGILADEMGLGKTIQTIALLAHLACDKGIWGPHLVIVPTSVLLNWEQEFHKWLPGFKVLSYYGGRAERKLKRKGWSKRNAFHVCITSYQLAIQDASVFKRKPWYYMILDEAQAIKNFRSQRWQTLLGFKSSARLLLTGTPLQNSLIELWSLMYFLMPEKLGLSEGDSGDGSGFAELDHFREWFSQPLEKLLAARPEIAAPVGSGATGNVEFNTSLFLQGSGVVTGQEEASSSLYSTQTDAQQAVQKLHTVLRPHILRRLKQDVETQLPNKVEHVVYCNLSKRQRFLYDDFMSRSLTRETLHSGTYLNVMGCLMQLRKVCNHPDLFETRPIVTSWVMSGSYVASYRRKEDLVRRLLRGSTGSQGSTNCFAKRPWQEDNRGCMSSWGLRGLVRTGNEQQHDRLAWSRARALDATPGILYRGLMQAEEGLEIVATEKKSWDELQMRPVSSRYTRVDDNARNQKWMEATRSQGAWMRLAENNRARVHGLAFCPIYGASTLQACQVVPSVHDRLGDLADNLALTGRQRLERYEDMIANFVCITPPVVVATEGSDLEAVNPHLRPELGLANAGQCWVSKEQRPNIIHMHRRVSRHTGPMRSIEVRQQIAFPEPFLLQYDCGKLQALERLLGRLVREGHRALLFTQMTKVLDILEKWLNLHGYRYLRLDGATKVEQRWRLTERFNHDPKWKVFISSTRAGGLGINLTGADTVIFYDSDWNHAMDAQCQDRCHRIGQQREVHIYRLISESTIEEAIWRKQCEKRWLNQVVIQEGRFDPNADKTAQSKVSSDKPLAQAQDSGAGFNVGDWYDLASTVLAQTGDSGCNGPAEHASKQRNRLLSEREATKMLGAAEDVVDAAALKMAITEVAQADALDLGSEGASASDHASAAASMSGTQITSRNIDPANESTGAGAAGDDDDEEAVGHIDDYMFRFLMEAVFN
ncbi:swr1 complex component [Coemansia sp. RSA 1843]|nr:swr1 complex component [Coemansia sp. RSA 1843]